MGTSLEIRAFSRLKNHEDDNMSDEELEESEDQENEVSVEMQKEFLENMIEINLFRGFAKKLEENDSIGKEGEDKNDKTDLEKKLDGK